MGLRETSLAQRVPSIQGNEGKSTLLSGNPKEETIWHC